MKADMKERRKDILMDDRGTMKQADKMSDHQIISLFLSRNELAIKETDRRYGAFSRHLSYRLLNSHEDAEECVNDSYFKLWETIPPTIPESLKAYLGKNVGYPTKYESCPPCWQSSMPIDEGKSEKSEKNIVNIVYRITRM